MSGLPSIDCLRNLRLQVLAAAEAVPLLPDSDGQLNKEVDVFRQLWYLRSQVLDIVSRKSCILGVYSLFFEAWELFSALDEENEFYVPPLYKSSQLTEILKNAVRCVLEREMKQIRGNPDNTGHIVLGGVEGAGKTTVMRVIAMGTSALLQRMIPITHDFSDIANIVLPSEVIAGAFHSSTYEIQTNAVIDPINLFNSMNHDVLLLLDEFQHVFVLKDNQLFDKCIEVAAQVHVYSRKHGTYVIIGGSSVDMQKLMFKDGSNESMDIWRKYGYPNFNGSLYAFHTLPCLRSIEELSRYIHIRYPRWLVTDDDIAQILCYTGGVGRWVHDVWRICRLDLEEIHNQVLFDLDLLKKQTAYRRIPQSEFIDSEFGSRQLIVYLCCNDSPSFDDSNHGVTDCGGVEKTLVLQALRAAEVAFPSQVIEDAVAKSVIYVSSNDSNKVQFLRPIDFKIYSAQLPPKQQRLFLLTAVYFMVYGIVASHDSRKTTDVNAGNALEEFVRSGVFSSANVNEEAEYNRTTISIAEGLLHYKNDTTNGEFVAVNNTNFSQIASKHLTWEKEHGLDGISFSQSETRTSSKKIIWNLDMWQCKGGRLDVEIGGGNGKMTTAMANYLKLRRLQDVGDKQITEICLKAQVGMCMLVAAIHRSVPNIVIKPRKLVVTTTKKCSESCVQTLNAWKTSGGVQIEKGILDYLATDLTSEKKKALSSRFSVDVVSGCQWIINSIPEMEGSLKQLATKLLKIDETHTPMQEESIRNICSIQ